MLCHFCVFQLWVLFFLRHLISFTDAHNTFNLFDKKGDGRVSTKELEKVFKSLALQINDEQLKEWADEMDEEGRLPLGGLKKKSGNIYFQSVQATK